MPRSPCLAIVVAAMLAARPCRAADDAVPEPPVPEAAAPSEAAPVTAADGTASIVVPAAEPPLVAEPPAGEPRQPAGVPAAAAAAEAVAPPFDATQPPTDNLREPPGDAAAALLAAALEPLDPAAASAASATAIRPLTLLDAVRHPGDPSRRLWITQAYWKAATAGGWLRWAGEAVERLELVAPGADPHDRAVLDVATAAARADLAEARSQFGVAQQELVDLARLPVTDPLPRPVDLPLASPYQTHFDAIFAARIATGRTRAIARTLPARHEALEARADAVAAADRALAMAESDHARGRRPIEAVVAAHAALVGQQREFLAAVRAYNLDIAEYAMAAADLSVPDDRFVAMLIGPPAVARPAPP